jgi:5-methylcytosine-specific restriction endonuclease McrA
MKPSGENKECPICSRVFKWSAVINHMKAEHGISPEEGFTNHLREKYCPHCEKVRDLASFSKLQDPEKVYSSWCKECNFERNIRRSVADQDFDLAQYLVTRLAFCDKCFLCNISHDESMKRYSEPLHIDHMKAFARGGALGLDNVILLCRDCNLKKGTKDLEDYLLKSGHDIITVENYLSRLRDAQKWAEADLKRVLLRGTFKVRLNETAAELPDTSDD